MTHRGWCFTENNPEGVFADPDEVIEVYKIKYMVYQLELGEEGTLHLQGYIEFASPRRLAWCRRILPRAHWETRRGTPQEASNYCKKDDTRVEGPWEFGAVPHQGERNDLHDVKKALDEGASNAELFDTFFPTMVKFHRGIQAYRDAVQHRTRNWKTRVVVSVGPTACGKSFHSGDAPNVYFKPRGEWWNGYDGQKRVVLDDFYGWIPYDELLRLCDQYPMQVPTKGGYVAFLAEEIWITSNRMPDQWYDFGGKVRNSVDPFLRRIDELRVYRPGAPFQSIIDPEQISDIVKNPYGFW